MILYLFAEIKCHNCYYSVCTKKAKNSNILCYLAIRLARYLCSSTPLVYLLASERSERDTYRGKNEKIGDVCYLYIWTYVCHFVL